VRSLSRHVVAIGGGGFQGSHDATPLDAYILSLVDRPKPRVCFIPTAVGDSGERITHFYEAMGREKCELTHIPLFGSPGSMDELIKDQDVIYVSGGNTANLLVLWRLHGLDQALEKRAQAGDLVVCGPSAGGLCWFDCGVTDSFTLDLGPLDDGMGWIKGSFCPHYDEEPRRHPVYRELISSGRLPSGIAADGGAAAHYVDGELHAVLAERPNATVHTLALRDGKLDEHPLEARAL
jgi:dipeptidase E